MTRPAAACGTTMGKYHNVQPDVLETFLDLGNCGNWPNRRSCPAQTDSRPEARSGMAMLNGQWSVSKSCSWS
jgi:hypothetical protein